MSNTFTICLLLINLPWYYIATQRKRPALVSPDSCGRGHSFVIPANAGIQFLPKVDCAFYFAFASYTISINGKMKRLDGFLRHR
jgi:hypothetical protein